MTRDRRGLDHDRDAHHAVANQADSQRDVLALYRALLTHDTRGMSVICEHTRCLGCLAIGAVQIGIWFAIREDDDATPAGYSDVFLAMMREALDRAQAIIRDDDP